MRTFAIITAVLLAGCVHQEAARPKARSVAAHSDIKTAMVAASIYGYEVNTGRTCPCPYSQGGTCKSQSAWDRAGGAQPRCYRSDVTAADIKRWRELSRRAPERP